MPAFRLRVTTFNAENLFNRYAILDHPWEGRSYEKIFQATGVVSIASRAGDLVSYEVTAIQRNNTALAILDAQPDVLAIQEVENLYTLRNFNEIYLDGHFDRMICIDGNDPRGIDVGFLVRKGLDAEIVNVRTHVDEPIKGKSIERGSYYNQGYRVRNAVFSRDCLEVDLSVKGKVLTFLVNHLKAQDGTEASRKRRQAQAERVAALAAKTAAEKRLPVVVGDLNVDPKTDSSLNSLLKSTKSVVKDPFPAGTWTHYYASKNSVSRLDYILPHKSLKVAGFGIVRKGLTTKAAKHYPLTEPRYPTVGPEHTEASDHCPVTLTLEL